MNNVRKKTLVFCLLFAVTLCFTACIEKQKPANPDSAAKTEFKPPLVIALLPEQNVFAQKKRYKPLASYLSGALGMNVRTRLLDSYDAIYNEMLNNRVDAAFFGSLSYVVMNSKIDIEPIARPLRADGVSTYSGVIFARRDSGITADVATWKGKKIALIHKSTTAGYIFPKWYLHERGVKDFEKHFGEIVYMGSHDAPVLAVFGKEADIGCAKDRIFHKVLRENPLVREKVVVLASSTPVPDNTLGVRKAMDAILKERLKDALLKMDGLPEGREALAMLGAARFIATKKSEYGPILDMLKTLGLEPGYFALDSIGRRTRSGAFDADAER